MFQAAMTVTDMYNAIRLCQTWQLSAVVQLQSYLMCQNLWRRPTVALFYIFHVLSHYRTQII